MPAIRLREEGFAVNGWFMNPNIQPLGEYLRRRETAQSCALRLEIPLEFDDMWDLGKWISAQLPFLESPERCVRCCQQRLEASARKALELGLKYFSTSLLYSRYQPHDSIREYGFKLAEDYGLIFVYRDFREDWQRGIEISKQWELYRQSYCGCVFSEAERYARKLDRLRKN